MVRRSLAGVLLLAALLIPAAPAAAHNYSATAYADVSEPEPGLVRTVLDLEYVLLVTDGGREMGDPDLESAAYEDVLATGQDPAKLTPRILEQYTDTVAGYVLPRWSVAPAEEGAEACPNTLAAPYEIALIENVPHARIVVESDCRGRVNEHAATYRISTELFPGTAPGGMTTTIVSYDLTSGSGVAELDTDANPTFTTTQDWGSRMWEFFVLGAEHLLFGIDHILFLLALIVGSRRLRDIVLSATAFTVAHSVTFILAALGVVSVPGAIVEPIIALSIAIVALWHLWGVFRRRGAGAPETAPGASPSAPAAGSIPAPSGSVAVLERVEVETDVAATRGSAGFARADWLRTAVVFLFGLIHGVGFAGALGISEPFSWGLLGALLVFNVGIEVVQLGIIVVVFPLLVLLRRRIPAVGLWVGIAIAAAVAVVGLYWFVERLAAGG
ncbi:HupE/UreJ family protein [Microbacterium paludicola]|nr:HupE/UreJ family protein [Microbacterium paludicola]